MRTIQMTLDDELVDELDQIVKEAKTNRSAFTREALRKALAYHHHQKLLKKHREGYQRHPVKPHEFSDWEEEQVWGDECLDEWKSV